MKKIKGNQGKSGTFLQISATWLNLALSAIEAMSTWSFSATNTPGGSDLKQLLDVQKSNLCPLLSMVDDLWCCGSVSSWGCKAWSAQKTFERNQREESKREFPRLWIIQTDCAKGKGQRSSTKIILFETFFPPHLYQMSKQEWRELLCVSRRLQKGAPMWNMSPNECLRVLTDLNIFIINITSNNTELFK